MSGPLSPREFARIVRDATDEQLAAGVVANRELILTQIFAQMPATLDRAAVGELDAVVEWRIGDRPDGGHDRWQLAFRGGAVSLERDGAAEPSIVCEVGAVDFLRLCADPSAGPQLFLTGRLRIEGDLMLAAQMPALFRLG
jgi:hypothetical protein